MNRWPVKTLDHARHRLHDRFPGMKPARMTDEVRDALLAGRVSALRPLWLAPEAPQAGHKPTLFAWTADKLRTYALHATETTFVIVTVMEPNPTAVAV